MSETPESVIPAMTDPLSKHWHQPSDIRQAPMDEKLVLLTPRQYKDLHEYSSTIPSGVYPGKCWKRIELNKDGSLHQILLCWYGIADDPKMCSINFRPIEVVP